MIGLLKVFFNRFIGLSLGITPIYIFDGCPPKEKLEIIKNRKSRRRNLLNLFKKWKKSRKS